MSSYDSRGVDLLQILESVCTAMSVRVSKAFCAESGFWPIERNNWRTSFRSRCLEAHEAGRLAAARPAVVTKARAFTEACRMEAAELKSTPAAEKRHNPQPKSGADMIEDEHGIMRREVYAIDE